MRTDGEPGPHKKIVPLATNHVSGRLDPGVDFERYREAACRRFIKSASMKGYHARHDLHDRAQDFYSDFWLRWLKHPHRELVGPAVPYIAGAMMNMLRTHDHRGRSIRASQIVLGNSQLLLELAAAADLDPIEHAILYEELAIAVEIVRTLPWRERVAFAAVLGRDSRKKGAPAAGYKRAAAELGIRQVRAKKLSLAANRRIRTAAEQVASGSWCARWASSVERVAVGEKGEPGFHRHAERCIACRMGVVALRRRATHRDYETSR